MMMETNKNAFNMFVLFLLLRPWVKHTITVCDVVLNTIAHTEIAPVNHVTWQCVTVNLQSVEKKVYFNRIFSALLYVLLCLSRKTFSFCSRALFNSVSPAMFLRFAFAEDAAMVGLTKSEWEFIRNIQAKIRKYTRKQYAAMERRMRRTKLTKNCKVRAAEK